MKWKMGQTSKAITKSWKSHVHFDFRTRWISEKKKRVVKPERRVDIYAMIVNNLRTYSEGDLLQGNCSLSRNRQELWGITDQNYGEITMSIY